MIVIVDYGMGNVGSIQNMLKKIGHESLITDSIETIGQASKLILPGVGHFDRGMEMIEKKSLVSVLNQKVITEKTPVLGICLGMQLMTNKSEEGEKKGLGWVDVDFEKFKFQEGEKQFKTPHMSWNFIMSQKESKLLSSMPGKPRFYFVHSYFAKTNAPETTLTTTYYGVEFISSFEKENIIGVQFHPEKSHKYGMQLMKNFIELY